MYSLDLADIPPCLLEITLCDSKMCNEHAGSFILLSVQYLMVVQSDLSNGVVS